jgi:hypothetical protein
MAIFIGGRPDTAFTRVPNAWARDPKLTTKAKGLLLYLLSHEDGYQLSLKQVIAENADGRDAICKTLAELTERGYLRRDQRRGERGKVGEVDYYVTDSPVNTASWFTASGESGSGHDQGKQDVSAGGAASWNTGSGSAVSGKPAPKKTRVLEDQALEDQNTISLSGTPDSAPPSTVPADPEAERENEEASQKPETQDPVAQMLLDAGCPTHQLDDVRKKLTHRHQPRSNAWWRTVHREGDLPALVADILEALKPAERLITTTEWRNTVSGKPECPCGEPGGNLPRPVDDWMVCASCRKASGWTYQDSQPRTEDKTTNGRYTPHRNPTDMAAYYDWSSITDKPVVRSPADRVVADALPLYERYKRQEMAVSPGATLSANGQYLRMHDSHHPGRDYTEDF